MKNMRKVWILLFSVFLAISTAACGQPVVSAEKEIPAQILVFTDDLGRTVRVDKADRVVTMIGSFADIWCLAGGKDTLVATANDTWTSFDLGLRDGVADIGAIKTPSLEVILSAEPDLVLASCNTSSNVEMLEVFEKAGITVAYFDVQNFRDYLNMLDICTQITGCRENYTEYGQRLEEMIESAIARQTDEHPSILCVRVTGSSCKVKNSTDNLLGEMLADLGCVNIADGNSDIMENLSLEAIMEADPDYIFAVLQGADPTDAEKLLEETLLSNPAWNSLRAVQCGNFYILENSMYNLKPNARWGEAYEKLADILYPKAREAG